MTDIQQSANNPGLVMGIVSCVCAAFGFFIPVLGLLLAIVGLVLGIKAYRAGKTADYQPGLVLGLIGALTSGISLVLAAIAVLSLAGLIGGLALLPSQKLF